MPTTYDVFARKEHAEPLVHIGSVEAKNDEEAVKMSLEKYGPEREWVEMVAVPGGEVVVVFSEQKEQSQ